jgi:SP family myo-inositol transporter-like MFS transporter 13
MVFYLLIFGVGMSPMPWAINAEIYPLRYRARALSIATGVNWLSNYVVSATFLDVAKALSTAHTDAEKGKHPDGAFWYCVVLLCSTAV